MLYATPADVRAALSPDGEQDNYETAAGLTDDALNKAIGDAVARINGYLAKRYQVPVDTATYDPDGLVKSWTTDIAAYYATLTFSRGQDISPDDPVRLRYNDAMKMLDRVQSGNLSPNWPVAGSTNASDELAVVNRYCGDMFRPEDFDLGDSRRPWGWGRVPGWGDEW